METKIYLSIILSVGVVSSCVCSAQVLTEGTRFRPTDLVQGDSYARSFAIGQGVVAVGARTWNTEGPRAGSVYLYDVSDVTQPQELAVIRAWDADPEDNFGAAVAISGTLLVVGAPGYDGAPDLYDIGSVYLFDITDPSDPVQLSQIVLPVPRETRNLDFGTSLALDGDLLAVSAPGDREAGTGSGAVYTFDIGDPTSPVQMHKLLPNADRPGGQEFGASVAVLGDRVAVGAPKDATVGMPSGQRPGAVYCFQDLGATLVHKLVPITNDGNGSVGTAVGLDGNYLVAGAPYARLGGPVSRGAVFVHDWVTGNLTSTLTPDSAAPGDLFGADVAVDGDLVLAGAVFSNHLGPDAGAAFLFDLQDLFEPVRVAVIGEQNPPSDSNFGAVLAMKSGVVLARSRSSDDEEGLGAASIFTLADCDSNGQYDVVDISQGLAVDSDDNAITDACESCSIGDLAGPFGDLDFFDVSRFLAAYGQGDLTADFATPFGTLDFHDVAAFLAVFSAGCP